MWLLVVLILAAVVLGLWVGGRAQRQLERAGPDDTGKTIGQRIREGSTRGLVSLWKWNRARKKKKKDQQ